MPIPGTFLLVRWALGAYPQLWFLVGPIAACLAVLVLSSWWEMIFRPTCIRRYVKAVTEPWDRG
jgi:hypothetical protein